MDNCSNFNKIRNFSRFFTLISAINVEIKPILKYNNINNPERIVTLLGLFNECKKIKNK